MWSLVPSIPALTPLSDQAQSRIEALQRNPDFRKYVENLQSTGYFREEREGSQLWKTMYDRAAAAFVEARRDECVATLARQ